MIGFDEKNANPTKHFEDQARGIAKVGKHAERGTVRRDAKADGISGVVGNGEGTNNEVSQGKFSACLKEFPVPVDKPRFLKRAGGEPVAEDGQMLMKREQHSQGSCVIAVFMSEEDPGELLGRSASRQQTRRQLSRAQSGIDEEGGRLVAHEGRVSIATAGERDHLEHSADLSQQRLELATRICSDWWKRGNVESESCSNTTAFFARS